jgi:hypothetical protein
LKILNFEFLVMNYYLISFVRVGPCGSVAKNISNFLMCVRGY